MNSLDQQARDRARQLMMAALDGELVGQEREELDRVLDLDAGMRQEWTRMQRVKEVTVTMGFDRAPEEVWDHYFDSVYARLERGLGWILVSLGSIVLVGYGLWAFLQDLLADTAVPAPVKFAIFAVLLGGLILFVSIVRERWIGRSHDPYRGIQR